MQLYFLKKVCFCVHAHKSMHSWLVWKGTDASVNDCYGIVFLFWVEKKALVCKALRSNAIDDVYYKEV